MIRIAPEGRPFIAAAWLVALVGAAAAGTWGGGWRAAAGLLAALAVWMVSFFRDPERLGPRGDHLVIAPADGRVVSVATAEEPRYVREPATRVAIFLNVFDVHVNRYPSAGVIELVHHRPGKFFNAARERASLENEHTSIGIRTPWGRILVRQIAGLVARRVVTDGRPGDAVAQGARLGMIRFGSRVEVFLPHAARPVVRVAVGDHVRAGETVLAEVSR